MELRYRHDQQRAIAVRLLEEAFTESTEKYSVAIKGKPTAKWNDEGTELEVTIDGILKTGVDATIRLEHGGTLYITATSRGALKLIRTVGKMIGIGNKPAEDMIFDKLNRVFGREEMYVPISRPVYQPATNPTY
jgi:hypothetical protein